MAKVTSSSDRSKRSASKRPTSSATRATRSKASSNSTTKLSQSGGGTTGSARVTSSGGKTVARTTTKQMTLNLRGKVGGMKDGPRPTGDYGQAGGKVGPAYSAKTAEANRSKGPATRQGSLDLKGTRFKAKPRVPGGNFRAPSIPKPPAAVKAASKGTSGASKLGKAGAMAAAAAVGINAGSVADGTLKGKPVRPAPRAKPKASKAENATKGNFGKSFKAARAMGSKVFMFKGKKYNTKRKDGK